MHAERETGILKSYGMKLITEYDSYEILLNQIVDKRNKNVFLLLPFLPPSLLKSVKENVKGKRCLWANQSLAGQQG